MVALFVPQWLLVAALLRSAISNASELQSSGEMARTSAPFALHNELIKDEQSPLYTLMPSTFDGGAAGKLRDEVSTARIIIPILTYPAVPCPASFADSDDDKGAFGKFQRRLLRYSLLHCQFVLFFRDSFTTHVARNSSTTKTSMVVRPRTYQFHVRHEKTRLPAACRIAQFDWGAYFMHGLPLDLSPYRDNQYNPVPSEPSSLRSSSVLGVDSSSSSSTNTTTTTTTTTMTANNATFTEPTTMAARAVALLASAESSLCASHSPSNPPSPQYFKIGGITFQAELQRAISLSSMGNSLLLLNGLADLLHLVKAFGRVRIRTVRDLARFLGGHKISFLDYQYLKCLFPESSSSSTGEGEMKQKWLHAVQLRLAMSPEMCRQHRNKIALSVDDKKQPIILDLTK
jgi:hypothetical protein